MAGEFRPGETQRGEDDQHDAEAEGMHDADAVDDAVGDQLRQW